MPTWNEILAETQKEGSTFDVVRRRYLRQLHELTGRNLIVYYSGWLQKPNLQRDSSVDLAINDSDKNGFMATIHKMDRSLGLDLFLHTPGGDMASTESLVQYLRSMFGTNIRAFVPQIAMSAGTMIACACKEIYMGKHSSIGPIDPQFDQLPADGVIEEFERAAKEIKSDPDRALVWNPILRQIQPAFLSECEKAVKWASEMVKDWLVTGMLDGVPQKQSKANRIVKELSNRALTKSHSRHISFEKASQIGLNVQSLETQQDLQDAVLSVHHSCILTLESTAAYKMIENHAGIAFIQIARQIALRA